MCGFSYIILHNINLLYYFVTSIFKLGVYTFQIKPYIFMIFYTIINKFINNYYYKEIIMTISKKIIIYSIKKELEKNIFIIEY